MKNLTIHNIEKAVNGKLYYGDTIDESLEASDVVIDSRKITEGSVFIATKGERVDGHSFIPKVFENKAMLVICEDLPDKNYGPCIVVDNSFDALRSLASFYRDQINARVVGITGSVGKTTTKEFVAGVLSAKYNVLKTQGNLNNTIGLPLTVLSIRDEHEIAVCEMGINQFNEMRLLSSIARPDVAVITNIGDCHLEALIDRDGVLKAKTEIFEHMNKNGQVILNGDDDKLKLVKSVNDKKPTYIGINDVADFNAIDIIDNGLLGSKCRVKGEKTNLEINIAQPGRHMVYNALTAIAIARYFNLSDEEILNGLEKVCNVSGRSNVIRTSNYTVIDDCYNANPTSVKAAIDMLSRTEGRKVAILGDMYELGENEKALHAEVGKYATDKNIDCIICIGEISKNMYEGAKSGSNVFYYPTKEQAIEEIRTILQDGDVILIKASHGMAFEKIVNYLTDV